MGTRPLRQHYDEVDRYVVDDVLGSVVEPWRQHRTRLLATVGQFDEAQWDAPTQCTGWSARDVISHLVTVDRFFASSLQGARDGTPTRVLPGFDPTAIPEMLVVPMREVPSAEVLEQFATGLDALMAVVDGFDQDDWRLRGESPFGLVPARLVLAHAFWDSWVHERDILVPVGAAPAADRDEAFTAAWYSLFFGCAQGGLLGDDGAGAGPEHAIDTEVLFAERPDRPVRVHVGAEVQLGAGTASAAGDGATAVPAVAFVDAFTRRGDATLDALTQLPADLRAQLQRGQLTF